MGTILAIDPGNMKSGYVVVEHAAKKFAACWRPGRSRIRQ